MPAEHKSQLLIAVLGFAGVVITSVSSNWDKWFPRAVPPPVVTPSPSPLTTPPEPATPPASPTPRVSPTPHVTPPTAHPGVTLPAPDTPTPPATTTSPAMRPPSTFTPAAATTRITAPRHGAKVAQRIAVEGVLADLRPEQHVFLCVQSQAFGRLIYPQSKVVPDATGHWTVESIYGTPGYSYETFLVVTTNDAAAAMLSDQHARKYGLRELPPGTARLGTAIVVTRE